MFIMSRHILAVLRNCFLWLHHGPLSEARNEGYRLVNSAQDKAVDIALFIILFRTAVRGNLFPSDVYKSALSKFRILLVRKNEVYYQAKSNLTGARRNIRNF